MLQHPPPSYLDLVANSGMTPRSEKGRSSTSATYRIGRRFYIAICDTVGDGDTTDSGDLVVGPTSSAARQNRIGSCATDADAAVDRDSDWLHVRRPRGKTRLTY
jgi:hypothetical protein